MCIPFMELYTIHESFCEPHSTGTYYNTPAPALLVGIIGKEPFVLLGHLHRFVSHFRIEG